MTTMTATVATLKGFEAKISDENLEEFRMTTRGDVLTPHDAGYATVRSAYNAMHPGKPALVVRPTGTADVISAVNFARENGLILAVRGGGHSVAGLSSVDGGLLLDLARMNAVDDEYNGFAVALDRSNIKIAISRNQNQVQRKTGIAGAPRLLACRGQRRSSRGRQWQVERPRLVASLRSIL